MYRRRVQKRRLPDRVSRRRRRMAAVLATAIAVFLALLLTGEYRVELPSKSHASPAKLPVYGHAAIITGSMIILTLSLVVLLVLAIAGHRRR